MSKNVVVLQPSYIPWRGYFHQIYRSDIFVFYDDVQYDTNGWRNRNQIKTSQGKQWLTIPVRRNSPHQELLIKDVEIDQNQSWSKKHLKALTFSYSKAPYFKKYLPLLESFYERKDLLLADFVVETTIALARLMDMKHAKFLRSSEIDGVGGQKSERLIQLLLKVGATHYISGPSAQSYLDHVGFDAAGITVEYMKYDYP